ncbi:hypothetical protein N9S52_01885 [Gammaproteobacteria bacterium]|nr:hypothetical protein [Gammaproteobacteria bacterium]
MHEYPPEVIIFISFACMVILVIGYVRDRSIKQDRERAENDRRTINWQKKRGVFDRNTAVKKTKLDAILRSPSVNLSPTSQLKIDRYKSELKLHEASLDHRQFNVLAQKLLDELSEGSISLIHKPSESLPAKRLHFPLLNSGIETVIVRGNSVNIDDRDCSCDWITNLKSQKRIMIPKTDIRWVCRHQAELIFKHVDLDLIDASELSLKIINQRYRKEYYLEHQESRYTTILFGFDSDLDWIDVFVDHYDDAHRYGYSLVEKRWAFDQKPKPGSRKTVKIINQYFSIG